MTPEDVRHLFPITATRAYLFSGGMAPAATPVREAHNRWTESWTYDPATPYAEYQHEWEELRQRFATLIGAEAEEIALVDHTSRGSNLIVQMLPCSDNGNVIVDDYTYPSSLYPWLLSARRHVEIRRVPARNHRIELDDIARAIDRNTIALSVSHVSPKSGFRHDLAALAELAHASGAYLIVDAAQSAGALDLDVRRMGVDFLTTCAMKWLLGAPGVGFLFIAREHVERFEPPQVGYAGARLSDHGSPPPLTYRAGARRHEQGMPSLPGVAASRAALDLLLATGMSTVQRHVLELSGAGVEGLLERGLDVFTQREARLRAGVIALPVSQGQRVVQFLRDRAVDVWTDPTQSLLRIDPHIFNNTSDLARLFVGIDEFRRIHGASSLQRS